MPGAVEACRGCCQKPTTLDKEVGYCFECKVLRDGFATAALIGFCQVSYPLTVEEATKRSYNIADAMMKTRDLPPEETP